MVQKKDAEFLPHLSSFVPPYRFWKDYASSTVQLEGIPLVPLPQVVTDIAEFLVKVPDDATPLTQT